jgi:crooked neck
MEKTKEIFERVLKLIPHKKFTFSKLWIMYAKFNLRCKDVDRSRKIFGLAIGKCPKEKIF